jgi:hypothetical protein
MIIWHCLEDERVECVVKHRLYLVSTLGQPANLAEFDINE